MPRCILYIIKLQQCSRRTYEYNQQLTKLTLKPRKQKKRVANKENGKTRLVIARYFLLDTSCRLFKLGTFRYHENSFYVTDIQHVHNKIKCHKKFGIKVAV